MFTSLIRRAATQALLVILLLALGFVPALAQTALNSSTLAAAVTTSDTKITVTSASNIVVGDLILVDREWMRVDVITSTTLDVSRGLNGSLVAAHVNAALFYSGVPARFGSGTRPQGACTRTAIRFLPYITTNGDVWDCPVGAGVWSQMNPEGVQTAKSVWFNLDNGAGTTIDDVLISAGRPIRVIACRAVEVDATAGTVAAGNWKVGTTVGGAEIVAATAYTNSATVGARTAGTIVAGGVAANGFVAVRHTGVAATAAGQAYVECDYVLR